MIATITSFHPNRSIEEKLASIKLKNKQEVDISKVFNITKKIFNDRNFRQR